VTGARVAAPAVPPAGASRGAWNRCTVDDPQRSLAACRAAFGSSAPGVAGRAQALIADGVAQAWQGNDRAAADTLDRAIAVAPVADAYINRALLRMRRGDDAGAIADLTRAIRRDPSAARAYHYRGILLARRGKAERAQADAARAIVLDPDYAQAPR